MTTIDICHPGFKIPLNQSMMSRPICTAHLYFQYIDEHLGGYETIKNIWERSRSNANSVNDVSFTSINEALECWF